MRLADIVRKGTASIVAAAMLSAGCATRTTTKVVGQYPDDLPRVGLPNQPLDSFDDILEVNVQADQALNYIGRLNEIRTEIYNNQSYNPQSDLRRLLLDVERSSFDSRLEFSHALRNYGYEREIQTIRQRSVNTNLQRLMHLIVWAGVIYNINYSYEKYDKQREDEFRAGASMYIGIAVGITASYFIHSIGKPRMIENSTQRTRHVPLER